MNRRKEGDDVTKTEAFQVEHLTFFYPEQLRPALTDVSFALNRGELVTLCGRSGSGKTTLLRQLKPSLAPHGTVEGHIWFEGVKLEHVGQRAEAQKIGFVQQSPDNQLVTDKVWHELAFGLESLGMETRTIRLRVAEMASFFGIQNWFDRDVAQLSGGQKQLLNLASVMALQPSVLILDEPTSQLDPIAATEFLAALSRIHRELGTTILLSEQRLEEALPLSDRVLVLDGGKLLADGAPGEVGELLRRDRHPMFRAMPTPMRVWAGTDSPALCPVTVREGREWLAAEAARRPLLPLPHEPSEDPNRQPAIELREVWFRYDRAGSDVVKGLDLTVPKGTLYALLGGNGVGKTTVLSLIAGLQQPYRGEISLLGRPLESIPDGERYRGLLGVLPQNPQTLFVRQTVESDLEEILTETPLSREEKTRRVRQTAEQCGLAGLLDRHPYDLSGGEQQRAALAKVLLTEPKLLLLDEPTKGMDAAFKDKLAELLRQLTAKGTTILMVSHDVEFCAEHANRCGLLFDGAIVSEGSPRDFFSASSFYTTAASRMAREICPEAVTAEDLLTCLGADRPVLPSGSSEPSERKAEPDRTGKPRPARRRRKVPWRTCAAVLLLALCAVFTVRLSARLSGAAVSGDLLSGGLGGGDVLRLLGLTAGFVLGLLLLGAGNRDPARPPLPRNPSTPLSGRTRAAAAAILVLIPLTIWFGIWFLGDRKYYFISLLVLLEAMAPFAMLFEGRRPQARELTVLAVLCALAVAGRAAFFMLPNIKPVAAIVIVAGVAFGGESGFLVGAASMLISNLLYSQGPWTPWQMLAMGMVGFLAGVLFRKGLLRRARAPLAVFGFLAAVIVYGGIINPSSVLMYQTAVTWPMLISAWALGFPFDLLHGAGTFGFLFLGGPALLEKLDRIKVKYGLVERER